MTQETAGDDLVREEPVERTQDDPSRSDVEALTTERDELKDLLLRRQAEFENFRKRTERERTEFVEFALADCMKEILNVLDSFELALRDTGSGDEARGVHHGYELIYKQLLESLQRFGLEAIEASGVRFDPNFHQAVNTRPSRDVGDGMILEELRKGYLLKGRLLRPAMVTVASPPVSDAADAADAGEGEDRV